jgi:hypothetical protein
MRLLSPDEMAALLPAETSCDPTPIPTQIVSSDELERVRAAWGGVGRPCRAP